MFRKASGKAPFTTSPNLTPRFAVEIPGPGIVKGFMGATLALLNVKTPYGDLLAGPR